MTDAVLDASAVLAFLRNERGAELVRPLIRGGLISAVNIGEVINRRYRPGESLERIVAHVRSLEMRVIDFGFEQAVVAASLEPYAKAANLSFADRACLALGIMRKAIIMTADQEWGKLDLGVEICVIREPRPV